MLIIKFWKSLGFLWQIRPGVSSSWISNNPIFTKFLVIVIVITKTSITFTMSQERLGALHVLVHLIQHIKETKQIKWFAGVHNQKVKSDILNHTIWFQNYCTSLVNPQGNQSWIFIWRTETEAEAPVLWPPDVMSQLIRKDPDDGKDWRQEKKGMIDDKMVEWHHQFIEHESEQTSGDGEEQGSLACCSPWSRKESDKTEWLNNNKCICSVAQSCPNLHAPWTVAHQVPLSMKFSRPEY